jgi:hypothetical protein
MSPPALDYARLPGGRHFAYDDGEQLFVKDPATDSGRARYVIDFSIAADAASDPNRSQIVWQTEFKVDPLILQSGGRTIRLGSFSTGVWVSGGETVQQLTVSTGDSGVFARSPIQQLIGRPVGLTIPVGGTWTTVGGVSTNVAFISGTASANVQPLLESDSSTSLERCLYALQLRRSVLTGTQTEALERQLEALLSEEEEFESPEVSEPSLHGLVDFLSEHKALAHPSLSITRTGYFAGSWSPRRRAKLTIIFNPGGTADWIAIDLDATHPVHEKGSLPNLPDDLAMWMRA